MEAPALLLIDFWRLPSTDVLTKRTDNLSSRTLINNSDVYEDFQNGSWYLELQAFIFLPSALENHPDMVGVTKAWVQMFGSNLRNGATAELAQTTWASKFQNQRPTMLKTSDQTQDKAAGRTFQQLREQRSDRSLRNNSTQVRAVEDTGGKHEGTVETWSLNQQHSPVMTFNTQMFGAGGSPWMSAAFSINLPQRINGAVSPLLTSIHMNGFRLIQELKALDLPPTKGRNRLHLMVLVALFDQLLFLWTIQMISVSAPRTFIQSQTRKL